MSVFEPSGAGKVVQADNLATPEGLEGFIFKRIVHFGLPASPEAEAGSVYRKILYAR